jgi:hypothetical protein
LVGVGLKLAVAAAVTFTVPVGLDSENGFACYAGAAAFDQPLMACPGPAGETVVGHDCNEMRTTQRANRVTRRIMSRIWSHFAANMGDSRSGMLPCRLFAFRAPVLKVADASRFTSHCGRLF